MPIEHQCYITCSGCGKACRQDGYIIYGETGDCVKDLASDDCGWIIDVKGDNGEKEDFCRECQDKQRHKGEGWE